MPRYTKKPITIDARQIGDILERLDNDGLLESWVEDAFTAGTVRRHLSGLMVNTMEGSMYGADEWWLIRGIKGELYPCDPVIFEASYVLADEAVKD